MPEPTNGGPVVDLLQAVTEGLDRWLQTSIRRR